MAAQSPARQTFEVRPHPTKSRALYALHSLDAGQTIASFARPLLLLPSLAHLTSVCTHCLRPGSPRACSRCHAAYYCDSACQAAAWTAVHARECKALQKHVEPERRAALPTPVRALVQALLVKGIEAGLDGLEGHAAERREAEGWQDLEMMAMAACAFAGKGTAEGEVRKAVDLLCKIQTNSFHRYDADLGQVGIFLEPTLAMANHSCIPNAMVQFVGRKAILRAERPIKMGEEIEISYTDYTSPLSKRKEALSHYMFECRCRHCEDDLNVYQVCGTSSPITNLTRFSLVTDGAKLRENRVASNPSLSASANSYSEAATRAVDSLLIADSAQAQRSLLQKQYRACKQLVKEDLWAMSPLPNVLSEISISYAEDENFPFALAISCHIAIACDPYRHVAAFHSVRLKGLFMIAKLLANTAADTVALTKSVKSVKARAGLDEKVQETLLEIDQVSLCQMLLIMVLKWMPIDHEAEVQLAVAAKEMLTDICQLPGREKESSLIDGWQRDPNNERSRAFFDYAVVQQVDALASLGKAVLKLDFEVGS